MSDEATTLACSEYFLGCSQPCLTEVKEAKVARSDLAASFTEFTSARSAFV